MHRIVRLLALPAMLILVPPLRATAGVTTTFDAGLEGWLITGDNHFTWQPAGGNPGGNLDVNDSAIGDHNYAVAPPSYLGVWSAFGAADTLSCDVYMVNTSGGSLSIGPYTFRIAGPGGAAHYLNPTAPTPGTWTRYAVSLDPASWVLEWGSWTSLLASVTSVRLNAEFIYGSEEVRLDNVALTGDPVAAFTACLGDDFNDDTTGDWTFRGTGGASNPGAGGNGGGCVSIVDGTGATSFGLASSKYLGDWTALDGDGAIVLDLRIASGTGNALPVPEFIRLSGPGGAARAELAPGDLPPIGLVWKHYDVPIDAAHWVVESGTWAGLLAEVAECRIQLEFLDGTETVLLDNFGRSASSCAPIDETVVDYGGDIGLVGPMSFVGIDNVALNPADGRLYGLVRTSSGGLYCLTGPTPSTRLQAYDRAAHLIFDEDGDAFVTLDYAGTIARRTMTGGNTTWVTGFHSGDDDPYGLAFAPSGFLGPAVNPGDLLVTDRGNAGPDQVWAFSPDSSEGERLVMPDPGEVDIFDLTTDMKGGRVWACDALDDSGILRLLPDGSRTGILLAPPIDAMNSLVYDWGLDVIYVASGGGVIYRVNPETGDAVAVAAGFRRLGPCALEIDVPGRRLWAVDSETHRVYEFSLPVAVAAPETPPTPVSALVVRASPNPFRAHTEIGALALRAGPLRAVVFDARGAFVREIAGVATGPGWTRFTWDGADRTGRPVAAGTYWIRVDSQSGGGGARVVRLR